MSDGDIFLGMLVLIGLAWRGAVRNRIWCFKAGAVWSCLIGCVGLAYFGVRPFFGGAHDVGTYFGCLMFALGVAGWLLFRGISIGLEHMEIATRLACQELARKESEAPKP